jgi:rhodanese-related sulfurtransferase
MSQEISRAELETKIEEGHAFTLLEALPPKYYAAGHLPGAFNLPLAELGARAAQLAPDPAQEIVVYCSGPTCENSHQARHALAELGYRNVRVFSGGKAEWTAAGKTLEGAQ